MKEKVKIRQGDTVVVIAGKDIDKEGRVIRVYPKQGKALVEGVNYIVKHQRKSYRHPEGGRLRKPAPIRLSNVMLKCPECNKPVRVGFRIYAATGNKERYCRKCDKRIDLVSRPAGKVGGRPPAAAESGKREGK